MNTLIKLSLVYSVDQMASGQISLEVCFFFIALKSTSFVMIVCVNLIGLSIQCKFHSHLTISNKDYLYYSAIKSCGAAQTPMEHCISISLSVVFFVALKY